jgi:hypothetical protein
MEAGIRSTPASTFQPSRHGKMANITYKEGCPDEMEKST